MVGEQFGDTPADKEADEQRADRAGGLKPFPVEHQLDEHPYHDGNHNELLQQRRWQVDKPVECLTGGMGVIFDAGGEPWR